MTITKADLEIINGDLETANAALQDRIDQLEAALAATGADDTQRDELSQTLWIGDRYTPGKTRAGKPKVNFSAQKSVTDQGGQRHYGPYRSFVAYGDLATTAIGILQGDDHLVDITAFESPWTDRSRRSDWVITSIAVRPRKEAEPETTDDSEVPF
jgi:hypothetical protein